MKRTFTSRTFYPRTFNPVTLTGILPNAAATPLRKPIRLKLGVGLQSSNGLMRDVGNTAIRIDQANEGYYEETVDSKPSESQYVNETVGTQGYCYIENLDKYPGFYTDIGFSSGNYGLRLYSGEVACFRLHPDTKIFHRAGSVPQTLLITILEN